MLTLRLILLSCLCAPLLSFSAEARESYLSSGVEVSKTASNSNEARRRAVSEAEQRAFREVAARAFPQYKDAMDGKPLDPKLASAAVTEMNINQETVTDRHYGGKFAIRFNPALMKEILRREYGSKAAVAAKAPQAAEEPSVTALTAAPAAKTAAKAVVVTSAAPDKAPAAKPESAKPATPKQAILAPKQPEAPKPEQPKTAKFTAVQPMAQQLPKPKSEGALIKLPSVLSPRPAAAPSPAPTYRPAPPAAETFGLRPVPAERPVPASLAEHAPRPAPSVTASGTTPSTVPAPERAISVPDVTFLPVLEQSDQSLQWDQDNPWLSSWRKLAQENGSFALPEQGAPVLHPLMLSFIAKRDLQEVDRLRIQEGYPGSRAGGKLFMATGKYYYSTEDKKPVIETTVYQISPVFRPGATTKTEKHENETLESLADRAAREAYSAFAGSSPRAPQKGEDAPKGDVVTEGDVVTGQQAASEPPSPSGNPAGTGCKGSEVTEKLRAEAAQLQEWISVEKRLKSAEGVKAVRPLRLSPGNMQIEVTHTCDAESLASSLVAAGLPYNAETHTIAQGTLPPEEATPETF